VHFFVVPKTGNGGVLSSCVSLEDLLEVIKDPVYKGLLLNCFFLPMQIVGPVSFIILGEVVLYNSIFKVSTASLTF